MKQRRKHDPVDGYVRSIPKGATYVTVRSTVEKSVVSYWFNGQQVEKEFPRVIKDASNNNRRLSLAMF